MRYDHRSSRRGGGRPRRDPAPRDRGYRRDAGGYEDEYDEEEYDEPPRSNVLPWIVVSVLVLLVFVVIIWWGMRDGGSSGPERSGVSSSSLERLTYGSFSNVRYRVKFQQTRMEKTEDADTPFNEKMEGMLTVGNSPSGGTAALELEWYEAGRENKTRRPLTDSAVNGRSYSFRLGPHGDLRPTDLSLEMLPLRALVVALFPDLPEGRIDPKRLDSWALRSPDALFSVLPFAGRAVPQIRTFDTELRASTSGPYPDEDGWLHCVKLFHTKDARVGGQAQAEFEGRQVQSFILVKASGEYILDWEHGIPCHANILFEGFITLNPNTPQKVTTNYKFRAFLDRIPD